MIWRICNDVLILLVSLVFCHISVLTNAAEPPAVARLSGVEKERVVKLIDGAKKERELVGYSAGFRPDIQAEMIPKFLQEYGLSESDLQVKIISTRTGAIVTKITEELRAKVYRTDFVHNGTVDWFNDLIKRGEIMAYDSPESKYFHPMSTDNKIGPTNPPYYVTEMFSTNGIVYNPKYIKEEIVHWNDVLRPEYKGKISCGDVSKSFSYTDAYVALRRVMGLDYWRGLAKQDPFFLVSASDLVNKSVSGEYPIVVLASPGTAFRANLKGAGLKIVFPPEGWSVVGYPTAILAHAPHPDAAKLWIDFTHSEVGQKILLKSGYAVGRLGIKSEYHDFPLPIYNLKGFVQMDWRKISTQDRDDAREEFRRILIDKSDK